MYQGHTIPVIDDAGFWSRVAGVFHGMRPRKSKVDLAPAIELESQQARYRVTGVLGQDATAADIPAPPPAPAIALLLVRREDIRRGRPHAAGDQEDGAGDGVAGLT